jgi:acyl carrier protein phosphodiesterase
MNFLAHLFLSCESEDLIVGNFIADFISNKEVKNYSDEIQKGIVLHRSIDSYTDTHPIVRKGTERLRPYHRKYSPVVIDVLYDYLLAKNWKRYSSQSFSVFRKWIYEILQDRAGEMPMKVQQRLPRMIEHDWLKGYSTYKGLQFTFDSLDRRTSFPSYFTKAVNHLKADQKAYNEEFLLFFPEVIAFVDESCRC